MTLRREPSAARASSEDAGRARASGGLCLRATALVTIPVACVAALLTLLRSRALALDAVLEIVVLAAAAAAGARAVAWIHARWLDARVRELARANAVEAAANEDARRALARELEARTEELRAMTSQLRDVLDHVPVGVLTIDADGRMGPDWSLAAECLLGAPDQDAKLSTHLSALDPTFARRLELGWEQVSAGVLPVELALDQLPKQLQIGQHHFRTSFVSIQGHGRARYLVVIEETTAALQRRTEEEANLELAASLARFLKDRDAFGEFLAEGEELAACIVASATVDARLRHALHTLKGNALMMGLEPIAHHCHVLESLIAATGDLPTLDARLLLRQRLQRLSAVYGATDSGADGRADVRRADLDALVASVQRGAPHAELLRHALELVSEPVSARFERLADHTASLAARLGRPAPTCTVVGGSIRLDRRRYARFWSALGHVARNALAHGIEPPEERERGGKSAIGAIVFAAYAAETQVVIEVSDDGRGVDWDGVRERARALGLPARDAQDLVAALFVDGLSTAAAPAALAGRGVGLGAVRAAVADVGGSVTVESAPGAGTRFRFALPREGTAPASASGARWRARARATRPSEAVG